ncbi:MAG: peroxiredoxin family protein [Mariniblastus sp.]
MKTLLAITMMAALVVALGCDASAPPKPVSVAKGSSSTPPPMAPDVATPSAPKAQGGPTIGEPAPEIEGVDLDGVEFKLSDYRGKVVMLDFYGDW